ncbi:MAG: hypothetical protein IT371_04730 [Deltaproteobacteria bacterium]|nr:hypothetical protein [Deltaproteobacteria bacterium]
MDPRAPKRDRPTVELNVIEHVQDNLVALAFLLHEDPAGVAEAMRRQLELLDALRGGGRSGESVEVVEAAAVAA